MPNLCDSNYISNIANIVVAAVAVISAIYAAIQYHYGKKKSKITKACDLSRYYADHIIWPCGLVSAFIKTDHRARLQDIPKLYFSEKEAQTIITRCNLLKKGQTATDLLAIDASKAIHVCRMIPAFAEAIKDPKIVIDQDADLRDKKVRETFDKAAIESITYQAEMFILTLLNNLEWFSMNFEHGVADESVVYQSLHSSFLGTIQSLYFFISLKNESGPTEKYYTNIMGLYNKWKRKQDDSKAAQDELHKRQEEISIKPRAKA